MDHSTANLIPFPINIDLDQTIHCSFTHQAKEEAMQKGESAMHTKEQREQNDYYREIAAIIQDYDEVLLFGPTDAKTELYHTFQHHNSFTNIKVEIRPADKLTKNQQHALVRKYFEGERD